MDVREDVKHRAMMMGISTGRMPNVELIWAAQIAEGNQACFGYIRHCSQRRCRWRNECLALGFFEEMKLPIAFEPEAMDKVKSKPKRAKPTFVERAPAPAGTLEPASTASRRS